MPAQPNRFARSVWLLGALTPWMSGWLCLGIRSLVLMGANPHPFLPNLSYSGVMLKAVAEWALHALAVYVAIGGISGFILFIWQRLGVKTPSTELLGFWRGAWVGLGSFLLVHGLLFLKVPASLASIPVIQHLPMGLSLACILGGAVWCLFRGFHATWRGSWQVAGGVLSVVLLLKIPHDLFRRMAPQLPSIPHTERRLLVLGIDGLRQDLAESAQPSWKAPGGSRPVVAVPATRLAWNMLLGADPDSFRFRSVIPFKDEFDTPPQSGLLDAAKARGLRTIFIIDDSTTLSFVQSRTPFDEVYEPTGGWKHFFTVGAGACWPVYSWVENYLSYVETTNPWSDSQIFLREVGRTLEQHHWVSAHTCQLHAPFFLRIDELQALRPWSWLLHPARAYQPYQSLEQAEKDRFRKRDGRSNPINHYRIRAIRILNELAPLLEQWSSRFPNLSGVITSDHGEEFVPVIDASGTKVSNFTGIHGFSLTPETLYVPLHPFGSTQPHLGPRDIYSWLDLRDDLGRWVSGNGPLQLTRSGPEGWLISFPTVQAVHTQPKDVRDQGGVEGAGMKPEDFIRHTYLDFNGFWFMDAPQEARSAKDLSWALILPDQTLTLNPIGNGTYLRAVYYGYNLTSEPVEIPAAQVPAAVTTNPAKRPLPWANEK